MDFPKKIRRTSKFQVSSFKFQVSSFKFRVSSFKFRVSSFKFQISNFKEEDIWEKIKSWWPTTAPPI
ncbi:Uncharacterized protein dnm_028350 [Desulfonema magnum]|uniref:Uncharacterized protein n=1 Tax=Desulfonema magnum TaxID=45655 RepID=A0A975BK18_9BACT|nr:Uncharacterized protein dnm_028350 [Desulfonema magnum]